MSDYRPWEVGKDKAPVDDASAAEEPPIRPVQPSVAKVDKEQFEQPPGLAEVDKPTRRGPDVAGAMLLWIAGLLFIGGIVFSIVMTFVAGVEELDDDHGDAAFVRDLQLAVGVPTIVAGLLFGAAGMGLMYKQPWARKLGYPLAIIAIPTIWLTTPAIVALVFLGREFT